MSRTFYDRKLVLRVVDRLIIFDKLWDGRDPKGPHDFTTKLASTQP